MYDKKNFHINNSYYNFDHDIIWIHKLRNMNFVLLLLLFLMQLESLNSELKWENFEKKHKTQFYYKTNS